MSGERENFHGLRVAALESRLALETAQLIRNFGGVPMVAPSMREVPFEVNTEALEFADRLAAGKIDAVIFLTGVGTRALVRAVEPRYPRERFVDMLARVTRVARGPKPVAALKELGIPPDVVVPEPNTWREILPEFEKTRSVKGLKVAVQEYGISNTELITELRERGAHVIRVPVYRWALPEDRSPLRRLASELCDGAVDVLILTNAVQIHHLLQIASEEGLYQSVKESMGQVVVASIGPMTSEALEHEGLPVDIEAKRSKLGLFVREVAAAAPDLVENKRARRPTSRSLLEIRPLTRSEPEKPEAWVDSPFMRACRKEPVPYTPVWIMRQAGRYMKEYRDLRRRVSFLELCKSPDLAAEVTVMAVEKLGVDAAIIFSDILLIVEPMGVGLEFAKGEGPFIHRPVRTAADVDAVREVDPKESLPFVYEAIRKARANLDSKIPLIGFAGAPYTVVSYIVEGKASRDYLLTKSLMYQDKGAWDELMRKVSDATAKHLNHQVDAGAQAIQIFDSWVGSLSPDDYREFVLPHMKRLIGGIRKAPTDGLYPEPSGDARTASRFFAEGAPVIHFGTGTAALLELMRDAGGSVIGLDWRVRLDDAWKRLGNVAVQGNLDPVALFSDRKALRERVKSVLDQAGGRPGHIFNLGHGILPQTPYENAVALVDLVHELSAGRDQNK